MTGLGCNRWDTQEKQGPFLYTEYIGVLEPTAWGWCRWPAENAADIWASNEDFLRESVMQTSHRRWITVWRNVVSKEMEKWRPASGERVNGLHNVLYDMQCGMKKNSDGSEISDILTAGLVIGIADHVKVGARTTRDTSSSPHCHCQIRTNL